MPQRCPKCGRFVSQDFVRRVQQWLQAPAGLAGPGTGRKPGRAGQIMWCPRCNTMLTGEAGTAAGSGSVRPPDLPSEYVHQDGDVLAGWDEVAPRQSRRRLDSGPAAQGHTAPPPGILPTLAIIASGLAGGFVGALLARRRRSLGAAVGTLAGAGAATAGVNLLDQSGVDA